ncbi:MAG: response regulator transcription factor [Cyanobacteriota bacterium]|nr:response regulator transcription factor [Cyanobacteriota bacterium]
MRKIRVILVEDDDLTRFGLRTSLQRQEEVELVGEAVNGREGLQLIAAQRPDVSIVDLGLPDIDGIELTARVKQTQIPSKILILTLQDEQEAVLAAFAAGADSYCMKNTRFERLMEAVQLTHEGNTWIDPAIARIVLSQVNSPNSPTQPQQPQHPDPEQETFSLTERELEVLKLIVDGYSNAAIATQLFITVGTVKTHVRNILNKLSADDRTQAAVRALRSGLVA